MRGKTQLENFITDSLPLDLPTARFFRENFGLTAKESVVELVAIVVVMGYIGVVV